MFTNEQHRINEVKRYSALTAESRQQLDDIVKLAANICGVPYGMITFIEEDHQKMIATYGVDLKQTARKDSFCTHTIEQDELLVVNHTDRNPLFAKNPFVTGQPFIRFYAGMPLKLSAGYNVGSLCVMDKKPKQLTDEQQESLKTLSNQVKLILELRMSVKQLEKKKEEIEQSQMELRSIYDSGQNFHLMVNREMKLITFNSAIQNYIVASKKEPLEIGKLFTNYIHEDKKDEFLECFIRAMDGEIVHAEQEVFFSNELEKRWWDITYAPVRNLNNTIIGVAYTAIDIHEKKLQRDKLLLQNQRLNAIAEIQSHQIRKPVASIIGLVELIKGDNYSFNKEYIDLLELSVKELDEKIHNMVN